MEAVRRAIEAYGRQGLDGVLRYLAVAEATGPAHVPPEEAGTQAFAAELRGRLCSGPGPLAGERTSDNRRLKQAPRVPDGMAFEPNGRSCDPATQGDSGPTGTEEAA